MPHKKLNILPGTRFGKWTVLGIAQPHIRRTRLRCECDCGFVAERMQPHILLTGRSTRCLKCRRSGSHGDAGAIKSPEYAAWCRIIACCENPDHRDFKYYGARGIRVCRRWRNSFAAFLADVGRRPSGTHSIDRINNNGHYEPNNVRWATHKQQMRNQRRARYLTIGAETRCITEWAELANIPRSALVGRIERGWPADDLLLPSIPINAPKSLTRRERAGCA